MIELVGVYTVRDFKDVHLLEFIVKKNFKDFDIGDFFQENDGEEDEQLPWDEKYLNEEGTKVIGDWIKLPKDETNTTRVVFFLHDLDLKALLVTPFGEIPLKAAEEMPQRLSDMVEYEQPD